MQPPGTPVRSRQQLSLDDFDYGYFDYDRPRRQRQDETSTGRATPNAFTVLPPLPPPTPSPPPAPTPYKFTSPTRRQKKASFVILNDQEPQLPGSARSIRVPLPGESKNLLPQGKSRIPRSQPVSRDPSPSSKRLITQKRRASVSHVKSNLPPKSKPASPKTVRKTSVKRQRDDSITKHPAAGEKDAHPSPSRIPRPPAARGRKSPAPSREPSPARKNSKVAPQKKSPSPTVNKQQPILRKNSNLKPLAGKPPLPPGSKGKPTGAEVRKLSSKPAANKSKTDASSSSGPAKTESTSATENMMTATDSSSKPDSEVPNNNAKSEVEPSKGSADSETSLEKRVGVNLTMASAPAASVAPAVTSPGEQATTSTTTATPDTSSTLVSSTTAPSLELAKPSSEPETAAPTKSSSAGSSTSAASDKPSAAVAVSMESVRSADSVATVRAASSPHPKKKATADDVAISEAVIKGDPDLESLSPNTQQLQPQDSVPGLLVAETTSASVEAPLPATPQSARAGIISRLCPCCHKFSTCLKKMDCRKCFPSKSIAGSKVGILDGSKAGMIGGSKVSVEEGSRSGPLLPPAGKFAWLRKLICSCSRKGGKCCSCCKKADSETADGGRRRSNATSRMSKKQSRSSSTAVEVDTRPKLDSSLVESGSMMRGAIPVFPIPLAWICLFFNIFVPGLGTLSSGFFCLCFGKPRFGPHDDLQGRMGSLVVNLMVGAAQLFTVIFCLVGWGWSIWWGLIMLRIAKKYRKLKLAEAANPEGHLAAPVTQNHDVERGRQVL
ncbi:hypothetical protein B7P43_G16015 [Cryptotermes secundus]|uniref:Protein stum n=1 Tax=Cryptotermes secundus TaxID=105785 RepID=A0A2J7R998_9NEOP|nr:protein stum [Cryptotermes secundus]PNF37408.1 hypothetical protein B7P43_G16015 [Cryptotermes secundus]